MEILKLENIIKAYKNGSEESLALNNLSLSIEEGDFISIIGQSGSGKSKLMHIIGGLDKPTSGHVYYNGHDLSNLSDSQISKYRATTIGFIFQQFFLDGTKTVLENVMMPMIFAKIKSRKNRKERALDALKKVNLLEKANKKAKTLSGGQQQRVAIARALVNNPKILLADEPTGNLDSKNGEDIMKLLEDLNSRGYTIIMVTHNIEQSYRANRIIRIKDGQIIGEHDVSEVNNSKEAAEKDINIFEQNK